MTTNTATPRSPRSLASTLSLALGLLVAATLIATSLLQLAANLRVHAIAVNNHQLFVAHEASDSVLASIEASFSSLETAGGLTDLDEQPVAIQGEILQGLLKLQPVFRDVALVDARGETIAFASREPISAQLRDLDAATRAARSARMRAALAQPGRYTSPIYMGPGAGEPLLTIAVPVYHGPGQRYGALAAELPMTMLDDLVNTAEIDLGGYAYVVDGEGKLITASGDQPVSRGADLSQIGEVGEFVARSGQEDEGEVNIYEGLLGTSVVGTYVPLATPNWAMVVETPLINAYANLIRTAAAAVVMLVLVALLAGLGGRYIARRLTVPLVTLMETATRIAAGERDLRAPVAGDREVAGLATAFNSMTAQLNQLLADLEQRVERRTDELQRANLALTLAKREAEDASRAKTTFLANMSHELRTPLNAIINFTKFLSKERYGPLNPRQLELQNRVLVNADHLLGLINDILDLAKIEAGRMELHREETDLGPLFHGVMATAVGLTRDKGLTLELDCPEDLPRVVVDRTRVRQVLLNLLSNAAKFTLEGGIAVRVAVVGAMVQVEVRDTGIGIAPEHQAMIFEEFRQVQDDLQREYQGTGLGLSISRRLIALHGGRMWVTSAPGSGSSFFFTLPLVGAPASLAGFIASGEVGSGPPLLIIDDDPETHAILRECLAPMTTRIYGVLDGREALEAARRIRPRLIILDILMTPLDGWDVLLQLRGDPDLGATPVVICSVVDQAARGLALGANDYLAKPVDEGALLRTVQRWLRQPATVLVIDDDPDARQVVRLALEDCYHVLEASDGREGLALCRQAHPSLIVLDLMMPEMDGFAVLEWLRADADFAATPVVVTTAKDLCAEERAWLGQRAQLLASKAQLSGDQFAALLGRVLSAEGAEPVSA